MEPHRSLLQPDDRSYGRATTVSPGPLSGTAARDPLKQADTAPRWILTISHTHTLAPRILQARTAPARTIHHLPRHSEYR